MDSSFNSDQAWARDEVRKLLARCMGAVAMRPEGRATQLRTELARRGVL